MGDMKDFTASPYQPLGNDGLTKRQYAAIKLKVPDSGEPWLDDMIRQSVRADLAAAALPWCLEEIATGPDDPCGYAICAWQIADAVLAARRKKTDVPE